MSYQMLIRPDDYAMFVSNGDGTFSHVDSVGEHHIYQRYPQEMLLKMGFFEGYPESIPFYKKKQNEYYMRIAKDSLPDGHGDEDEC